MAGSLVSPLVPNQALSVLNIRGMFGQPGTSTSTTASFHCRWQNRRQLPSLTSPIGRCFIRASSSPPPPPPPPPPSSSRLSFSKIRLYVSGLSFRTTEESLQNAFQHYGTLIEVHLVMDKLANRPRGFAFLRYSTEEESRKAIQGMHGKFLDGRVIFVEVAKPRSETRRSTKQSPPQY